MAPTCGCSRSGRAASHRHRSLYRRVRATAAAGLGPRRQVGHPFRAGRAPDDLRAGRRERVSGRRDQGPWNLKCAQRADSRVGERGSEPVPVAIAGAEHVGGSALQYPGRRLVGVQTRRGPRPVPRPEQGLLAAPPPDGGDVGPVPRRVEPGTEPVGQLVSLGILQERELVEDHAGDPLGVADRDLQSHLRPGTDAVEVAAIDAQGPEVLRRGVGVVAEGGGAAQGVRVAIAGEVHHDDRELAGQRLRQGGQRSRRPREGGQEHRNRPRSGAQVVELPARRVGEVPGEAAGMRPGAFTSRASPSAGRVPFRLRA